MKTVNAIKKQVLAEYNHADANGKELLKRIFPAEIFSEKITDRVKTYEDACDELGIDPENLPDVSKCQPEDRQSIIAHHKLIVVSRALNEDWKPNWQNSSEEKWCPWFDLDSSLSPSRFAFDDAGCQYSYTYAGDGSRLCFKTSALAEYAGRQFVDLYRDLILIY